MDITLSLIELCRKGDRRAEYELYKLSYSYLMSICIRYTRQQDKAMEVLNMGFFRILKGLDTYRTDAPIKPWMRRIMINTIINEYKKEKLHYGNHEYVDSYVEKDVWQEMSAAVDVVDAAVITEVIGQLPPATRQVFNLFFVDGYSHKEIASMLGISEGTSKWHLSVGKEKFKEHIQKMTVTKPIEAA